MPSGRDRLAELLWIAPRLVRGFGHLGPHGPADGPPALVIPGFLANDRTCLPLRRSLGEAGWRTHGWDLGLNKGAHASMLRHLRQRLETIWDESPVLLVGWSLGGLYARELAREVPDRVRAVVTLGSPFSGGPRLNNMWRVYEWIAGHKVDRPPIDHREAKPPVPTLAIWSGRDGIVAPRSARGLDGERDLERQIGCRHMAFGISYSAGRQVAQQIRRFLEQQGQNCPPLVSEAKIP